MDTLAYCLERCGGRGAPADHATAFLRPQRRAAVLAWLALHEELRRASRPLPLASRAMADTDPSPARLGWWTQELVRLIAGNPGHPVTVAVRDCQPSGVSGEVIAAMLGAHADDGEIRRHADWDTLRGSAATLVEPLSRPLGEALDLSPRAYAHVAALLVTREVVAGVRALRPDAACDRLNVPTDLLHAAGTSPARVLDGDAGEALPRALGAFAGQVREHQRAAFGAIDRDLRKRLAPALVLSGLAIAHLDEIERDGFPVWHQQVALTPLRMAWLAWRIRRFPGGSPAAG